MPRWSRVKDESVMHLAINGDHEWSGTWYRHVRPSLLNYQATTGWLTHQLVLRNVGHGGYKDMHGGPGWGKPVPDGEISCLRVWDYIALHIDRALELRLPKDVYPSKAPTKLKQIDRTTGYLVHPRAPEEILGMKWNAFRYKDGAYQIIPWPEEKHPVLAAEHGEIDPTLVIRRVADVPEDQRSTLFWIPDREMLAAWLKLQDPDGTWSALPPNPQERPGSE
jgi:hypothetical protein